MSNEKCEQGIISPFLNSCEPFIGSCAKITVISADLTCDGPCTATIKIENAVGNLQGDIWIDTGRGRIFNIALKVASFDLPNGTHDISMFLCDIILSVKDSVFPATLFAVAYGSAASTELSIAIPHCDGINIAQLQADCVGEGLQWTIEFDASGTSGDYLVQVLIAGVWTTMATEVGIGTDGTFNITPSVIPALADGSYTLRLVDAADGAIVSNELAFIVDCREGTKLNKATGECEGADQSVTVSVEYLHANGDYVVEYESGVGVWTTIYTIGAVSGTSSVEYTFTVSLVSGTYNFRVRNTTTEYITNEFSASIPDCSGGGGAEPFTKWLVIGKIDAAYNPGTGFSTFMKSSVEYNLMLSPAPSFGWVLERYDGGGVFTLQYSGSGNVGDDLSFALDANAEYRLQLQATTDGMFASSRMIFKTDAEGQITDYISAGQTSMPNSPSDGIISCHEHLATSLLFGLGATQWEAFTPGGLPATGVPLVGPDPISPYSGLTGVKWTTWFFNYADMPAGAFAQVDDNPAGSINQHMGTFR